VSASIPLFVIDDDVHFRDLLAYTLETHDYAVRGFPSVDEALAAPEQPALILLDWHLGDDDGIARIGTLRERWPGAPVILVTGESSSAVAVRAIKAGAFEFIAKPVDDARLLSTVAAAASQGRLLRDLDAVRDGAGFEGMLGQAPAMQAVFETIDSVARTDVSVLVTGESGTGKELAARAIHARSGRAGRLVALNMAALPRELVESTLFGHEKGAFSGADRRRAGACEEADGGTLFLDEIGEMPLELQAKLLRFLESRAVRRVGGDREFEVDARVVSATNRDPLAEVEAGRLRRDLYYRLNVVPVELPALRERVEDIPLLTAHTLRRAAVRFNKPFESISPEALQRLCAYPWPGNVRELVHLVERIVITRPGPVLEAHMLPTTGPWSAQGPAPESGGVSPQPGDPVVPLAELERRAILHALDACEGNRNDAANALGISPATIYRKLKQIKGT